MEFLIVYDPILTNNIILTAAALIFAPIRESFKLKISDPEAQPKPRASDIIFDNFRLSDSEYGFLENNNNQDKVILTKSIFRFLYNYLGTVYDKLERQSSFEDSEAIGQIPIIKNALNKPGSKLREELIKIINKVYSTERSTIVRGSLDYPDKLQEVAQGILEQVFSQSNSGIISDDDMAGLTGDLVTHIWNSKY